MAESWDDIIGKHVLVGMTYVDNEDAVIEQRQMHGTVVRADDEGVYHEVAGSGEEEWLPPHLPVYEEAAEDEHRLRSTGEVVIDPDQLCPSTIGPPEAP
jgi:hypothetical protein